MTSNGRIGLVTVSYGSRQELQTFLGSLHEHHSPDQSSLDVVVVDNKPGRDGVEDIAQRFDVEYLPLPANPGYGAGMNAGVRALRSLHPQVEYQAFFFCNPDVRFLTPTVEQLAAVLAGNPQLGSVGPRLLNIDGSVYPSARQIPSVGTGVGHALLSKAWPSNPWTRAYQNADDYTSRRPAGWLSGAAVMVKTSVFDAIQGWDESYFMHFEDIDLGWRIGQHSYLNLFDPSVSVEHAGAHSTQKHAERVELAMTESAIRFMSKRYPHFWQAPIRRGLTLALRARGARRVRSALRDTSADS